MTFEASFSEFLSIYLSIYLSLNLYVSIYISYIYIYIYMYICTYPSWIGSCTRRVLSRPAAAIRDPSGEKPSVAETEGVVRLDQPEEAE